MKYSIKFQLSPRSDGGRLTENVPIRIRVSFAGLRVDLRSGYNIDASKWDAENGRVILGAKNANKQGAGEINRALTRLATIVEEVLTRFELDNRRAPTIKEFKSAFDEAAGRVKETPEKTSRISFFEVFDLFTSEMGKQNNWTRSTYTKFSSLKMHLSKFRPELTITDFSKNDYADFVSFLINKEGLLNTTVSKNVSFLRWFLRWASANGYYPGLAHIQYRPRFKGLDCKEVIFLSWEELMHFLTFDFPAGCKTTLSSVRDVFCFCCFTGLRYSDVARLRWADVKLEAAKPYISIVTKKTTERLHIELNKYALSILNKYKGLEFPNGCALPVLSNVKMNERIHEAAEVAGLDEPIRVVSFRGSERIEEVLPKYALLTTHCGRRTFIVNALRLGIPAPVIMEWTGHSDYKAMKPYIKIVDTAKAENMAKFDVYGRKDD